MTIEYLSFCFVGRLLLEPSTSSSSSFIIAPFLIQMLRWIRGSSRVEFFIFLIAWGIFFGRWELDLHFLPSSLLFLWAELLLLPEYGESNQFLLEHIPWMNEFHNPGRPFKVAITTSAFFTASSCSWFERLLWLHGICILDLHILQLVSLVHILTLFFPSNSLKFWNSFACNR